MSNFALANSFGVNNVLIPKDGPKVAPALLDFTNTSEILVDGELIVSQGKIEYIQGVYIDNADNEAALTLTLGYTNQRVICPPKSQGYFALLGTNPPTLNVKTQQIDALKISMLFYNVPVQSNVWSVI